VDSRNPDDRVDPIDPGLYQRDELRRILASWDIAALFRFLNDHAGLTQRQIAVRTGQNQSEVAEILAGRRGPVVSHHVLRRLAGGFDIPPGR
jgi:antitoxin component HigA of HigAB toxin-antitoxin module